MINPTRFFPSKGVSMRAFLSAPEGAAELATLFQPVSADFEIACRLVQSPSGRDLSFSEISGRAARANMVLGNLPNLMPACCRRTGQNIRRHPSHIARQARERPAWARQAR
jgi:3-polyprenyl-4-hydroxybenzoate decarboxylase